MYHIKNGDMTDEAERAIVEKYESQGWKALRGGAPDLLMLKTKDDGEILDHLFVEIKRQGEGLTHAQAVYRDILEKLGAKYRIEIITAPMAKDYSTGEAAKRLGISFITLKRWIYAGKIKAIPGVSGRWKIPVSEVEKLLLDRAKRASIKEAEGSKLEKRLKPQTAMPLPQQPPTPAHAPPPPKEMSIQALLAELLVSASLAQCVAWPDILAAISKLKVFTEEKLAEVSGVKVETAIELCKILEKRELIVKEGENLRLVCKLT